MTHQLLEQVGEKLTIHFHAGQTRAWESARRFIFVISGHQAGKTSFLPIWLDREIREKGDGDYLACTSNYDILRLKFLPELRHYFVNLFGWEESKSEKTFTRQYKPRMFTRIICRSADAEGGLESSTGKAALFDECGMDSVRVNAWEAIQRRLSLSQGRVLAATTPYNLGWLKTQIYDKWVKGDPDLQVINFKSTMNPSFPLAEYERARRTLPSWKFEMFYNGNFSRPAGMIYGDFTQAHLIAPFAIPRRFPRYLGVDFGAVNTAKLWVAEDPSNGNLYVYRESLGGDKTTKEHVGEVLEYGEIVKAFGGAKSEKQQRYDWRDAGLAVGEPEIADVEIGIDKVIQCFKNRSLYIFSDLTGLIDELGTYARKLNDLGEPTDEIKDKSQYHILDALRYVIPSVIEQEQAGVQSVRYA